MNRQLQAAIARQQAVRRTRDTAWALAIAFFIGCVFFVLYFTASLRASPNATVAAEVFTLPLAALCGWIAWRLFRTAIRLGKLLANPDQLLSATAQQFSPGEEVWSALLPWTGRRQ